jgi:hypothetical protein
MREDGAQIDKIIITRSDDSKPSGKGPMESPRERVASVAPSLDANPDAGSSDLDGNGTELPTQAGRHTLFRYPYLQKERADSLAILWATSIKGSGSVTVRDANGEKVTTAASTTTRFRSTNTGLGTDFFQHQVTLTGLSPDTEFLYDVLHDGQLLARNVPFKTLPLPGSERIDFVTFGDSGTEYGAPRLIRDRIASRKPDGSHVYPHDMILGVGDLAYTDGSFIEFDHKFFDQLSGKGIRPSEHAPENGILASRVFFASLGNHEFGNKWAEVPEAYLASFAFPAAAGAPAEDHERYYSFDAGPAHFVMIDTMKFAGKQLRKQEMLDWLERDLAATKQPWKLAFFHHSFFSLGAHGTWGDQWENSTMRKQMVPILQKHGVQLAFFGHDHMYQRTQPIKVDNSGGATQGKILRHEDGRLVSEGGIVYVGAGNGGADLGNRDTQPSQYNSDLWKKQRGEWGIGYDFLAERNGHPILYDDISNDSDEPLQPQKRKGFVHVSVTREKVSVTAINTEGETLDAFEITR